MNKLILTLSALSLTLNVIAQTQLKATLADPLAWLYPDSKIEDVEKISEIDVPSNGIVDVNILLNGLNENHELKLSTSENTGTWFQMLSVPVKRNTGVRGFLERKPGENPNVARRAPFDVYDVLKPLANASIPKPKSTEGLRYRLDLSSRKYVSLPQSFEICFSIVQGDAKSEMRLKVNVHNVKLPTVGKESFKYTNWMSFHSMAASHGLTPWSEEHWAMIEKYISLAAAGRQNIGLIDNVFYKNDKNEILLNEERFKRFLDIFDKYGLWYIEGRHLSGFENGWGSPRFKAFMTTNISTTVEGALSISKTAKALQKMIDKYNLKDRWIQHVADEPGGRNVSEYRITAGIVRRYMPGVRIVDAVEEPSFAGALDIWCPKVDAYEKYQATYDNFRTNFGDKIWCYTCCIPGGKWMNRTMDGELLRPALIPMVAVMWNIEGFLHWGYNRWQKDQDPFKDPYPHKWGGANNGNSLPPGDTHIVYPGTDGPWPSTRLEATRAGMEDADLLLLIAQRDKSKADALVRKIARGFGDFTPSCKLYREVRREILLSAQEK